MRETSMANSVVIVQSIVKSMAYQDHVPEVDLESKSVDNFGHRLYWSELKECSKRIYRVSIFVFYASEWCY